MLLGSQVGPFLIEKELGSGAMGTVYLAQFEKEPGKVIPVALKVISLGLLGNEGAMARFDREAAILKQLKHPHIVRLLAVGKYRQTPFIAMEYVEGESLDRILLRRTKLSWEDVVSYGKQLCEALQHAHDKGIVHRDLKPSNLMVTREGVLKLTDFGIAKDTDVTALTGANSTIGTAAYMSPEQCRGDKTLGAKSDLYSLGVCLYELLTGKKPFVGESTIDMFTKHVSETPVRPRRHEPDMPIWLDNLVMFCLEKNKESRPLDAATIGRMLAEIEEKVQSQASVGAEIANARRVDRPMGGGSLNAADKEAAQSLRAGAKKKKKKKARPLSKRPWFRALPIVVGLLILVGFAGFMSFGGPGPEPLEALAEKVEVAGNRGDAAADFLKLHNAKDDPTVEKVRKIFREEKAKEAESGLVRRFNSKMRNNSDNYDANAFPIAISALEAEKAGDLRQAASLWIAAREKCPEENVTRFPSEEEVLRVRLRWVAEKRINDLKTAPEVLQKLLKQYEDDRRTEFERTYETGAIEGVAMRALRLELFGDLPKARRAWSLAFTEAETRTDLRSWSLIAAEKVAKLTEEKKKPDETPVRIELLKRVMTKVVADAAVVESAEIPAVAKRSIRNTCRDVIALYSDELTEPFPTFVKQAKQLLAALPK